MIILAAPGGTKNYSYNNLDQMLSITGAENKSLAWDAMGRMTTDGDRAYQWSVDDRLLTVNINSPPPSCIIPTIISARASGETLRAKTTRTRAT